MFTDRIRKVDVFARLLWLHLDPSRLAKSRIGALKPSSLRLTLLLMPQSLIGCTGSLSTLSPAGPAAAVIAQLWWVMLAAAAGLTLFVLALLAWGFRRAPSAKAREGLWVYGLGLGFSGAILLVATGYGFYLGERLQPRPAPDVTRIEAVAQQWRWTFTHSDGDSALVADNILYIPAGQPVDILITSQDVVHSFWVPRLAGKMDALPGHVTRLRLQADEPGLYDGLSNEFSGTGYGAMRFKVIAYPADAVPEPLLRSQGQP